MGHIELSRDADLIVVAPATADLLAKMAHGLADDLASTLLLATDKKILVAPAMNLRMWLSEDRAQCRRLAGRRGYFRGARERRDGLRRIWSRPDERAAGDSGRDRDGAGVGHSVAAARGFSGAKGAPRALAGRRVVVTSGPTHEPIDPVRYIANRSSGKQGHAIAAAAAAAGAAVTARTGPVALADPAGVETVHVETARQMQHAVEAALPADIFIAVAAVADWRVAETAPEKLKKGAGKARKV